MTETAPKVIKIACTYTDLVPLEALRDFQGDLKELSEERYEELKREILEEDLSFPFFVWKNVDDDGRDTLDGHQRTKVLTRMFAEGYTMEDGSHLVPVIYIAARDRQQAKRKLLAANARYGKMTHEGLFQFAKDAGFDFDQVARYPLPEVSFPELKVAFFDAPVEVPAEREKDEDTNEVKFEAYKNGTIKQVVLYYAGEDYAAVVKGLDALVKEFGVDDYSAVVWRLLGERKHGHPQA